MANEFKIKIGAITPNIQITDTTNSTSTTTGAARVAGGLGVSGNAYIGGNLVVLGDFSTATLNNTIIGNTTPAAATFTNLTATGIITFNTSTNSQSYTTTGGGTITISSATAGSINNMSIGSVTPQSGSFTGLTATGTITANTGTNNQSYTTTGGGSITITSATTGNINGMNIGATTRGSGAFTTVNANANTPSTNTTTGTLVVTGGAGLSENINVGGLAGIGASTQTGVRLIVAAQTTAVTPPANTNLHVYSANSNNSRVVNSTFGTGVFPVFTGRAARGTAASPTAIQLDDTLSRFTADGYGASAYSTDSRARIDMMASQNWTNTAQGTYIDLYTTPNNTITPSRQVRIGQNGVVNLYATVNSTDATNGSLVVAGGVGISQDLRVTGDIYIQNVKVQQIGQIITTAAGWNLP